MKIRTALGVSAFVVSATVAQIAAAANSGSNLLIGDITIEGGDTARIYVGEGTIVGSPPSCAGTRTNHFAINLATAKGKAMYDLAVAALLSGKRVNVAGANNCSVIGNLQTLDVFTLWR
jgi:hypothetical protein